MHKELQSKEEVTKLLIKIKEEKEKDFGELQVLVGARPLLAAEQDRIVPQEFSSEKLSKYLYITSELVII